MNTDSTDVAIAKQLLDHLKLSGFQFWRIAPGEDGPTGGKPSKRDWVDGLATGDREVHRAR
ncbi:MAG: hypothetical protein ACRDTX_18275 [Pseudonocardiaceae bacterium]